MISVGLLMTGVGGQGVATAAHILASAAIGQGLHATVLEARGLARRGGKVNVEIRVATEPCCAPHLAPDQVHIIVGLEPIETLRVARSYQEASVLLAGPAILPAGVSEDHYPDSSRIELELARRGGRVVSLQPPPAMEGPPNMFAVGALLALGATPLAWDEVAEVTRQWLGEVGSVNLERGREAVVSRNIAMSWKEGPGTWR